MIDFDLSFRYEGSPRWALDSAAGKLKDGSCTVLCGASGCGKSTLLSCMNGLIPQFYEGELKGCCYIKGENVSVLPIAETGRLAASVFQDPRSQFFTMNSSSELAFGLENFGYSHDEIVLRVEESFRRFGLQYLKDRKVFELSSGQRQLVAILGAWALDTDIFLLDEPTANLDFAAIESLRRLLLELKAQGKTLIISEHRLYYLSGLADEYLYMDRGAVGHRYNKEELLSLSGEELRELGLRCTDLSKLKNSGKKIEPGPEHSFKAENISFSYKKDGKNVLNSVSLNAERGEVLALVGGNGCGKTSFGKLSTGLLKPRSGSFYLNGRAMSPKELTENSIFIMQEAEFQFFTNSVLNELNYGFRKSPERDAEIKRLLTACNMWQCRNQHPFSLSGGQMQKLALLLACLSEKPLVVLDEPSAGLDYKSLESCCGLIKEMAKSKIVFVISHDMELISSVCCRACSIEKGRIGNEFDLNSRQGFDSLKNFMETGLTEPDRKEIKKAPEKRGLDPRTKIFIFIAAMVCGIGTHMGLISGAYLSVLLALALEKKIRPCCMGVALMGLTVFIYMAFPGVVTAFIISFFPRIYLICFGALLLVQEDEAPGCLAALRKLRVPEKIIMIFSVSLRFFPVLNKDIALMNQSVKTRGFFPKLSDKLRAVPEYLEIMLVPMVFRVIRIAEALSASAETRGIALPGKRDSFIALRFRGRDICMLCLTAAFIAAGLII